MAERETLVGKDPCDLSRRWQVREDVMRRVVMVAEQVQVETGLTPRIISGFRTVAEQRGLERAGRPAADPSLSTHTTCPATGVDISLGFGVTGAVKATFGRIVVMHGLRWGGGSAVDPRTGIPSDWNHVDAGPR